MKNTILISSVFFFFFFLWSCQTEVDIENHEKKSSKFKITDVNKSTIISNNALSRTISKFITDTKKSNKKLHSSKYNFSINTTFAKYVESEDKRYHSYTFKINRSDENDEGVLENLLASLQSDGTYKLFIVRYKLTMQERLDVASGIPLVLKGRVTHKEIEDKKISDIFSAKICPDWVYSYCAEDNHPNGIEYGKPCPANVTIIIMEENCDPDSPNPIDDNYEESNQDNVGVGSNGSNDSDSSETTRDITVPVVSYDNLIEECLGVPEAYNFDYTSWLNNGTTTDLDKKKLATFLTKNNCSEEAKDFAAKGTKALMNDGEVDFENRLIYIPSQDQEYINGMQPKERGIFNTLNDYQKFQYLKSAQQAKNYADSTYPETRKNGEGDAFRHAFWNALSTIRIGEELTKKLTDAHEEHGHSLYQYQIKEKSMDLFNNEAGRILANGSGRLYKLVEDAMKNGELRKLSHLDNLRRPTVSSVLIPTN